MQPFALSKKKVLLLTIILIASYCLLTPYLVGTTVEPTREVVPAQQNKKQDSWIVQESQEQPQSPATATENDESSLSEIEKLLQ